MLPKKKGGKKRVKKNIPVGVVHIQSTFNNTVVTITDLAGNTSGFVNTITRIDEAPISSRLNWTFSWPMIPGPTIPTISQLTPRSQARCPTRANSPCILESTRRLSTSSFLPKSLLRSKRTATSPRNLYIVFDRGQRYPHFAVLRLAPARDHAPIDTTWLDLCQVHAA